MEFKEKLLKQLRANARLSNEELAAMLGASAEEVASQIEKFVDDGIIVGFVAVVNEEKLSHTAVSAFIEVKVSLTEKRGYLEIAENISQLSEVESVRLMSSGSYDLALTVKCADMVTLGKFVQNKIAPINGVTSTATRFIIGRYKEMGKTILEEGDKDDRELFFS